MIFMAIALQKERSQVLATLQLADQIVQMFFYKNNFVKLIFTTRGSHDGKLILWRVNETDEQTPTLLDIQECQTNGNLFLEHCLSSDQWGVVHYETSSEPVPRTLSVIRSVGRSPLSKKWRTCSRTLSVIRSVGRSPLSNK